MIDVSMIPENWAFLVVFGCRQSIQQGRVEPPSQLGQILYLIDNLLSMLIFLYMLKCEAGS